AQGTGFILTTDGFVVTNAHVLSGARFADGILSNSGVEGMDLIGYNLTLDLALLKIDGTYEPLKLGDSNDVRVGEKVIAIGNPLGLGFSVSEGIVSGVHREGLERDLFAYIQTDAALNPGNSGGPLINTDGVAIGINNFKARGENIGFALESNHLKSGVNDITMRKLNRSIL
ncbi:trypsin-like serine protease, partial [Candidatus Pacearchaeota archaeon]|nr:trypsin-like serine protease [Candidatus Pacearchaeota archaeon]